MDNDTALILLLADRQREIEGLRAENARLAALLSTTSEPDPQ